MDFKLNITDRITREVIQLTDSQPFWAYLILKLRISEDTNDLLPSYGSVGINAKGELLYKKKWMEECSDSEIRFVLAHEVGHLVFGHLLRLDARDPMTWNIATDCVLNKILKDNGFDVFTKDKNRPEHGCICPDKNDEIVLFGKTIENVSSLNAETLYDSLPIKKKQSQNGYGEKGKGSNGDKGKGNSSNGDNDRDEPCNGFDVHNYSKMSENEKQKFENDWKNNVAEAATHAKMKGQLPAGMESIIGNILNPKLNWKHIILKYVKNSIPFDSSFSKPNKKFLANGIILPGTVKEAVEIVVHLDVSGSISDKEMNDFLAEMKGVAKAHRNVKMTVIQADMQINDVSDITTRSIGELNNYKRKGYGGTSHVCVFDYIKDNIPSCKLLISFTDGYSDMDSISRPNYDVIWGLTKGSTKQHIKWGKVVDVK